MKNITNFQQQPDLPQLEEEVLNHWDKVSAFKKSIQQRPEVKRFVFYDGPPFATGTPHYGHLLASTIKDVIPRYWTMKGFMVDRVWGWDCHGLPIENMIEQELDLRGGKKGIEELGIGKFNSACRSAILRFDKDWEQIIRRMGRWVDFKNSYKTMDDNYMESVWWGFKQLHDKGLVYEGHKVILYCPRCATPLSNFEIAMDNSYRDVEDNSVYIKFKVKDTKDEFFIAWTTTPWTLIGNVAIAVDEKATYVEVSWKGEKLWVAKKLVKKVFKTPIENLNILAEKKGKELVGAIYEPLYDYMPLDNKKAYYVSPANFVSLEEGTGIVHTAAIFGEDDYQLAQKQNLPCVATLDDQGKFLPFVKPLAGVFYKKSEQWIIDDLTSRNLMFRAEKTNHSYPFCYRCNTPLYFNAIPAWFINIQKIKRQLIKENKSINWYPAYLKFGRFGKGLETAPDWNVSRSRYWGTPMPIWKDPKTKKIRIIGSVEELKKWAVVPTVVSELSDLHREFLDDLEVWVDDEKTIKGKRIPEVFDCWVESASMPFASIHYPFENKDKFEKNYPAQFISEYIAQTRAWFYTLHVVSVGIFEKPAFQNAVATGTILAEDGSKMSKSKKNYPDPLILINKYGVDSLRLYLMSSPLMKADDLNFNEKYVSEIRNRVFIIWWNTFSFYQLYANKNHNCELPENIEVETVMDRWVISKIENLTKSVTALMDCYDVATASRLIMDFVNELSTKYVRESRDRIRDQVNNGQTSLVFAAVLKKLCLIASPITPFFTELLYQNLLNQPLDSIHLENWPEWNEKNIDNTLENEMEIMFQIAAKAHSIRKEKAIRVRQPLSELIIKPAKKLSNEVVEVLKAEVNVEAIKWAKSEKPGFDIKLDTKITQELKRKGEARETIRAIQDLRKLAKVKFDELVVIQLPDWPEEYEDEIKTKTYVSKIVRGAEAKLI